MTIPRLYFLVPVLGAVLFSTSCQTDNPHQAKTLPAPQAAAPTLSSSSPSEPVEQVQEKTAPKLDAVDSLVAQAEREYQSGKANYAAGHLEAAKQNFDRAFNVLLQGPERVESDDRLQAEFDKIVEGTRGLELDALKEGDGFVEQKAEPAPIDEASETTFPVDPKVKAAAEAEVKATHSDLPLVMNDLVAGYINFYFTRGHSVMERAWARAGRYRAMIARIFKEEGVPQDLIYLAQAESGFQPRALSRAGARGMWQFMTSRARGYGLKHSWWIDERQDPEKSTRAAAKHLKDLYNQFGDWYLVMAAYNSGPGNVQQAVRRTGFADFWELYKRNVLPQETKNYVPIILAIALMAKNPAQYGLQNVQPDPPLQADTVTIDYPLDLRLVAECVDASADVLRDLNPSLLRMTTPNQGEFALNLPAGTKQKFEQAIAAIPVDKRVWWRYHKVASGETLASIAREYQTTPRAITAVNGLEDSDVSTDTKLVIPIAAGRHAPGDIESMVFSRHPARYRVRKGDTILSVADDFGVPPERLRGWNHLKGNNLRRGRMLVIYRTLPPGSEPVGKASRMTDKKKVEIARAAGGKLHTVRSGETLYGIAETYGTTIDALRRDNPKTSAHIYPGEILVIK
jgi:membrane-bound lytic murein transglycosylase D